jgi:hypothetical protein
MQANHPVDSGELDSERGGKVRLLTLDDLDGRTRAAQRVRDTSREVMSDLGGSEQLSTLERAAVDHVSLLDTMVKDAGARWLKGDTVDPSSIATLVNAFNRTAGVLGWQRRQKDVTTLGSYLAHRSAEKGAAA